MQFFATASLFVAAVSGAAIMPRQEQNYYAVYAVSNFHAECLPHGDLCYYDFSVIRPNNGEFIAAECSSSVRGNTTTQYQTLPSMTDGQCRDSSRTFNITVKPNSDLDFSISAPATPHSNTVGYITIPSKNLKINDDGMQVYAGPKNFSLVDVQGMTIN